jgi:hypothetical protein
MTNVIRDDGEQVALLDEVCQAPGCYRLNGEHSAEQTTACLERFVAAEDRANHGVPTPAEVAYGIYEALTDPVDEAERQREASVTGFVEPSDWQLRAEREAVCAELGLLGAGNQVVELEAER